MEELERVWGKNWGTQGIGKLREVALARPTEHEVNELWERNREFFLLRRERVDLDKLSRTFEDYASLLESEGVKVNWMETEDRMGAYGPMRKLFMMVFCLVVRGGG